MILTRTLCLAKVWFCTSILASATCDSWLPGDCEPSNRDGLGLLQMAATPFGKAHLKPGQRSDAAPPSSWDEGRALPELSRPRSLSDAAQVDVGVALISQNLSEASANTTARPTKVTAAVAAAVIVLAIILVACWRTWAARPSGQELLQAQAPTAKRWPLILAAAAAQIVSGCVYAMGAWQDALRDALQVSMGDISTIVASTFIGSVAAVLGGRCFDKLGPRITLAIGGVICTLGYSLIIIAILWSHKLSPGLRLMLAALGSTCAGYSSVSLLDNIVCMACSVSFPSDKAAVVGYLKAVLATAAGVWALLWVHIFKPPHGPGLVAYLVFAAAISLALVLLAMIPMERLPPSHCGPLKGCDFMRLGFVIAATIVLSCFDVGVSFFYSKKAISETPLLGYICVALASLPFVLLIPPLPNDEKPEEKQVVSQISQSSGGVKAVDGISFRKAACGLDFWLIWFAQFAVFGSGVATNQNLALLLESAGNKEAAGLGVAMFALTSSISRMLVGVLSDRYSHILNRFQWIQIVAAIATVSQVMVASMSYVGIMVGVLLAGLSFGTFFTVIVPVIVEMYGPKEYGVILGSQLACQAFASVSICKVLLPAVYNRAAAGASVCLGPSCFRASFAGLAALNLIGLLGSSLLAMRNRSSMPMHRLHEDQ
mmetsp:Transcript_84463/g.185354  ORF Transcript_84463/g.185354 Transcript_84463/m.185354 type:complete len:657 (-) Transcript_84463:34-2004(-)